MNAGRMHFLDSSLGAGVRSFGAPFRCVTARDRVLWRQPYACWEASEADLGDAGTCYRAALPAAANECLSILRAVPRDIAVIHLLSERNCDFMCFLYAPV